MIRPENPGPASRPDAPVTIVRDPAVVPSWREWAPLASLSAGIGLAAALVGAAIYLRRRTRRAAHDGTGGRTGRWLWRRTRAVDSALPVLARAMRMGRAECRGLQRLAVAAGVKDPAVLLISEHAFRSAAELVIEGTPAARAGLLDLARALGFSLSDADGQPGGTLGDVVG